MFSTHEHRCVRTGFVLALLATPALALSANLVRVGGVLGTSVTYNIQGDPGQLYFLVPSLSTGPVPLAIVDPLDTRFLTVGLDLPTLWKSGFLNGAGQASVNYALPNDATLHGVPLHAQFVTIPGAGLLVDEISNRASFMLGQSAKSTYTVGAQPDSLDGHAQTLLSDGRVLLSGGASSVGGAQAGFRIFDPQTQGFSATTGAMQHARSGHAAVKLNDGRVMLIGGGNSTGTIVATCDIWDPATGLSTPAAPMSTPRGQHTATLLPDGRVYVAGGLALLNTADIVATLNSAQASTTIYNPATNSWSAGPNMPKPRVGHTATLMGNGQVLIVGGIELTNLIIILLPDFSSDCRRYNPVTNTMSSAAAIPGPRGLHAAARLSGGGVAVAGGVDGDPVLLTFTVLSSVRTYNPTTNAWTSVADMANPRVYPVLHATGGKLVALGGLSTFDIATTTGTPVQAIETAPESGSAWSAAGSMMLARPLCLSTVIENGLRIVTTGSGDNGSGGTIPDTTAEIYIP
jgi:N-acetylneuraminic acid mutarotase